MRGSGFDIFGGVATCFDVCGAFVPKVLLTPPLPDGFKIARPLHLLLPTVRNVLLFRPTGLVLIGDHLLRSTAAAALDPIDMSGCAFSHVL